MALLHVLDPAELEFPFSGAIQFEGLENIPEILADATALRTAYLAEFEAYLKALRTACRNLGVEYKLFRTDQPPEQLLAAWLAERMARVG